MTAALPDFVVVGGVGYRVETEPDLHVENEDGSTSYLIGHIQYQKCLIRIDSNAQEQAKAVCLFHEVAHAMLYQAGLDTGDNDEYTERVAQMLGYGIYGLLRANPELARLAAMVEMQKPSPPAPLPQGEGS